MDIRKPKLREYTEYFAKDQALPTSAGLVDGNGALPLAKGFTQNALNITICAKGAATVKEVSVQITNSETPDGNYVAIGTLYKHTLPAAKAFSDGEQICTFPLYDDVANGKISPWIKAGFGGDSENAGNFDAFIEYMPR